MLLHQFEDIYQHIRENALEGACTVLVLVAADVDGLCACRILTHMLRTDNVAYSLVPVSGYSHASALLRALSESNNDIRSVVLINCGAIVNVTNLLPWDRLNLTCYVIDSHRPIHLANIYERERVFVLHDEEEDMDLTCIPSDGEGLSGGENSDEEGSMDGEGDDKPTIGDATSEDEEERRRRREEVGEFSELESEDELDLEDAKGREVEIWKHKRHNKKRGEGIAKRGRRAEESSEDESDVGGESHGLHGSEEEESNESEDESGQENEEGGILIDESDGTSQSGSERSRQAHKPGKRTGESSLGAREPARLKRRQENRARRERRRRIEQYYMGAFHGAPSALVLHRLSQEVNRDSRDTLWLAIVGLTDLLVHQRIEHVHYRQMVEGLEIEVQASQAQMQTGFEASDGTLVPTSEAGRIVADFDYQFMLYRHWSLYESMYHSPYVASKLLVWWSHGKQRLEELLAKMGFSLAQCRENFKYMDSDLKAQLREELDNYHEEFGLDEVFYLSFHRRTHYGAAVSASDVVYGVAALLEAWQGPAGSDTDPSLVGGASTNVTGVNQEDEAAATGRLFVARFHEAYDALSGRDEAKLTEGIHLAMALQKAIFRVAVSLHDKKAVRNLDHFRWAVIHNNLASAEDYLLTQPMAISRLAHLMIDVSREEKMRQQAASQSGRTLWKPKPLLIFAERRSTYLVVGVSCPDQRGEVVKHRFASLFRLAADGCKARYRHDGFDSAVLELDKNSATRFTESLFLACDAARTPKKRTRRSN